METSLFSISCRRLRVRALAPATVLVLASCAGCGSQAEPWGPVSGQVLYMDKPAQQVVVLFSNPGIGIEMTAVTDAGGHFRLATAKVPGLPAAGYRVAIYPARYNQPIQGMMFPKDDKSNPEHKNAGMSMAPDLPMRYRDVSTSGLTALVTTGKNQFLFELKPLPN
jgi:hypothetical protein